MKPTFLAAGAMLALAACSSQPASPPEPEAAESSAPVTQAMPSAAPSASSEAVTVESRYTSLEKCKAVKGNEEEDWAVSRCEALNGSTLFVDYGDARDDLRFAGKDGKEVSLGLPGLGGGGFNTLGPNVEWRGKIEGGQFRPYALIVRNAVSEDPEHSERQTSLLAVIDLAKPCVVAFVRPARDQNQQARQIADAGTRPCMEQGG